MSTTTEAFAERVFAAALGAIDIYAIHLGDRLGFYRELAKGHPLTSVELAEACGCSERYVREWLEQQATSEILEVDLAAARYRLPAAHAAVLAEPSNSATLAPLARMLSTSGMQAERLLEAYRSGGGVSWDEFGPGMRESQADMNRPFFEHDLAGVLERIPHLHERLARPGARVADIGCGGGWSSIAIAKAYPTATVHGFDIDEPSIDMAREHAAAASLGDRVGFTAGDAGAAETSEAPFDVVFAFECVHDLARPVRVLESMRGLAGEDGIVIVMDEAVAEEFTGDGDEVERLMYGFSLLVCLPDGLSSTPSAGTGTVMRPRQLRGYAAQAGYRDLVSHLDAGFFRFYELLR